ncbi:MAG TPA: tetratricopeptide repeat protein, partial [Xanthomonadales bacterium]
MRPVRETSAQLQQSVWLSMRRKDIKQAIKSCNLLNKTYPEFAPGWFAASHLAQLLKQPELALKTIDRALTLEPVNREWRLHRVACLVMCGEIQSARESLTGLMADHNDAFENDATQLSQLAFLCNRLDMHAQAENLYLQLTVREPGNGGHWFNLATLQRFQGRLQEAESSLEKAISLNPADFDAY